MSKKNSIPEEDIINLQDLRKRYGRGLKAYKQKEIELFIQSFAHMAYKKYAAGAKEHKNDMTEDVAKKELLMEAIDLFIYAMVVNTRKV